MDMHPETLEAVLDLKETADSFQYHEGVLPEKVFVRHGSNLEVFDVPPPRRAHEILTFGDFCEAMLDTAISDAPEVYHDHERIVGLLDRKDRRSYVCMPLIQTARWGTLCGLQAGRDYPVQEAVKAMRFELHGTGIDPVITALRKVDFTRTSSGRSSVEHGREDLGRSVESAVQSADSIPEEFKVATPIYQNSGLRGSIETVRVGVFLDVHGEQVHLRTLADELPQAVCRAQAAIGAALREALGSVPVFNGSPVVTQAVFVKHP